MSDWKLKTEGDEDACRIDTKIDGLERTKEATNLTTQ